MEWERRAYLGGAVDSEAGDAGCGGGAHEGGRDGRDAGVLEVAVRVEEANGGGGARRSLGGHDWLSRSLYLLCLVLGLGTDVSYRACVPILHWAKPM